MKLTKLTLFLIAISVFGFACSGKSDNANNINVNATASTPSNTPTPPVKVEAPTPEIPTQNPNFKIEMTTNQAGNEAEMTFVVKDKSGVPVKDFQVVHEKKMHLIAVSEDLSEFEHLHPELQADGSFKVKHAFKHGGKYLLYPDVTPVNGSQVVQRMELDVKGEPKAFEKPIVDMNLRKTVDGITVTLMPEKPLTSYQEVTMNFIVTDGVDGKPVLDLQNYLGELAHVVIIGENTQDFLHVHPMSNKNPNETSVMAHTTFPVPGIYKIWAQFQRNNKVITVPFVVNVAIGTKPTVTAAKVENGAIKITVNGDGFTPAAVDVKKGEPVKLLFTRTDDKNCGGEVVFPSLNIKKELPVGQEVAVDITPNEAGEINFACGMNMMKGKIVVQ